MKKPSQEKIVVNAKKTIHRKKVVLLVTFDYNDTVINHIRSIKNFTWSQTKRGWVCPFSEDVVKKLQQLLQNDAILKIDDSITKKLYHRGVKTERNLTEDNKEIIRNYVKYLRGKRYSESTVMSYFTFIADFIDYSQPTPIKLLTNRSVELFE